MTGLDDHELLAEYARTESEAAFAVLVARYVNLVHSAAWRFTGNPHHAEEITQAVFIILARKAGRLRRGTVLSGWLYQTARLTAANFVKDEIRRQRREQEAYMQSTLTEPEPAAWEQIAPLLDEAMGRLGETDRNAIVLRFFENKTAPEVAASLKLNEAAAHKRVSRALDKLRQFFTRRGVVLPAMVLTTAIAANSVQAAPAALAKSVTAVAVAKGAAASSSTLTLIKGALKIMAWTKAKTVVVASVAVLFATGTTVVVVEKVVSPAVDESFWQMKVENLKKAPSVLIIRPTRYYSLTMSSSVNIYDDKVIRKIIAQNIGFVSLLQTAYSFSRQRMILPAGVPTNHFDLMLTLPDHQLEALQKAIQRQFGFAARPETRETDVLLLKVKDPGLLALHASKRGSKMGFKPSTNSYAYSNFPISMEAQMLEAFSFKPVILQPGLSGNYDITFQWEDVNSREQALANELAQAGLELVPSRETIEMLVVEKAN
jgi:uncharacterized protein (TIGR03435 family)